MPNLSKFLDVFNVLTIIFCFAVSLYTNNYLAAVAWVTSMIWFFNYKFNTNE